LRVVDTAPGYGNSETVLGQAVEPGMSFDIVTKTAEGDALDRLRASLARLKREGVYGLLVHRVSDLLRPEGRALATGTAAAREKGLVRRIGASVYSADEIDELWKKYPAFDLIQVPLNLFDQRLIRSGHLDRLKERGVEVHARSPFLQGLLFLDPARLPRHLAKVADALAALGRRVTDRGLSMAQAALGFACAVPAVDQVICGVNNLAQFRELCQAGKTKVSPADFTEFALDDVSILNPSLWKA